MAEELKTRRCAVYTRKSTDEGLEMDFNSLQAQREACEAFIKSQRSEGWKLITTAYDDGGISGGTMERPALQRLMADIEEKMIDIVVVYKVDRLTRSLHDFSRMVEVFDRQGVSFCAVTQQFNTTTSMGRLTLNVLLSFAQFEREVTAERIRDKIAASKKKGIWMGGGVPRGYRVEDRKLIVVPEQAVIVNHIFKQFLDCSGIRELAIELKREGLATPVRPKVKRISGQPELAASRGALYALLRNPIYVGLISHKGQLYPGQQEAIVDRAIWDAVQQKLETSRKCRGRPRRKTQDSQLMGKLFDEQGRRLTPTHAMKRGKRYRYYISHPDDEDADHLKNCQAKGWRLPAGEIEARVAEIVKEMLADREELTKRISAVSSDAHYMAQLLMVVETADLQQRLEWVERVELRSGSILVVVCLPGSKAIRLEREIPLMLKRRGVERRLVIAPSDSKTSKPDAQILKALNLGLRFWDQALADDPITAQAFAANEGIDDRELGRALPMVFLAPDLVDRIVTGKLSPDWTVTRLGREMSLPVSWNEQKKTLVLDLE